MKPWLRQGTWLAVALTAPVLLSLALLPLRDRVSDVPIALVLRQLLEEQPALRRVATLVARGAAADELFAAVSGGSGACSARTWPGWAGTAVTTR